MLHINIFLHSVGVRNGCIYLYYSPVTRILKLGKTQTQSKVENASNRDEFGRVSTCTCFIAMPKFQMPIIIGTWDTIDLVKNHFEKENLTIVNISSFCNVNVIYFWCKYYYAERLKQFFFKRQMLVISF
jgi:hypothetical protein